MPNPFHKQVNSLHLIKSSILTDGKVYRWFYFLITQPELRAQLTAEPDIKAGYKNLERMSLFQKILGVLFFTTLIPVLFLNYHFLLWLNIIFLWPLFFFHTKKKNAAAQISLHLVSQNFSAKDLTQKTLYQIGEILSRKYDILSLVDAIEALDRITRRTALFIFVFAVFVYPDELDWKYLSLLACVCYAVYLMANSNFVFKRLK